MAIVYKYLKNGAFVAGDTDTRITCYANPTSINAEKAKKNPLSVAMEMVKEQYGYRHIRDEYNAQNWAILEG